ncbi:MAG TPA: dihydropteroate synthase, partial [Novosphingobium sp.]|nr:dihydropteroate synthase [Novosphingobium sp.]
MTSTFYLRPIALADSPQAEEGEAVRLAGGLACASRFALIEREGGHIVSRRRFSAGELQAALPDLPDEAGDQWDALRRAPAPLACGERTIRLDQPQGMGILNVTPDSFSD